ncbi:hypothetical protein P691DRAFT_260253 [Macrolepiota fuliginosa MF-IS2]|uniref:Uncharacterized protein n=1 Tax=Macrolepiota fuliginosa MF-IS2 TaxID=1400762 RepID=A0A9P5WYR0_9AGAR|nr:hypothetical protein P691DRAFT_260253 [Macrolepiota fuliginosa MF-IS2]
MTSAKEASDVYCQPLARKGLFVWFVLHLFVPFPKRLSEGLGRSLSSSHHPDHFPFQSFAKHNSIPDCSTLFRDRACNMRGANPHTDGNPTITPLNSALGMPHYKGDSRHHLYLGTQSFGRICSRLCHQWYSLFEVVLEERTAVALAFVGLARSSSN